MWRVPHTRSALSPPHVPTRELIGVRTLAALCLIVGLQSAAATERVASPLPDPPRPRIGLVLGGGGAKGAAHIGVIKVLEEMRIPISCIAGTSMGAIVGAAYATGMSAEEIERTITAVDWKEILASAPRQDFPVHRKSLDFVFTNGFEVGVQDGGVVAPTGLVPTHQIENLFRRIVAKVGELSDFNQLPIPFRAVATDLESGAMVVFDHGDLNVAMRASMAVPGAFAPVDYEGRLHVDGMLVRNLPVDVARETCADVVIAVPVGNPAVTRKALGTLLAVAGQAMNIAIEANENAQLRTLTPNDVAIPVILQDVTSADFAKVPQAIPIGEAAARNAAPRLSRYSVSPQEYAEWQAHLARVSRLAAVRIDEVRLAGFTVTNPDVMRTFLRSKPGDVYDPVIADADTTKLVARGDFAAVSYRLGVEDGRNVLTYTAIEKPWGPDYLTFDLNLSTDFKGDTGWGARLDYEKRWLNALGGEFRTALQLGRPNYVGATFYQPLDAKQRFFVSPSAFATQTLEYLYSNGDRIAQLDTRRYAGQLEAGMTLGTSGELRVGVVRGEVHTSANVAGPGTPDLGSSALAAGTMRLTFDTLDKRLFPTEGTYGRVAAYYSTTTLGAERDYKLVSLNLSKVFTFGPNVWTVSLRGGTDFNSNAPFYDQFKQGGLFKFSGYRNNELIGREFAFGAVQYRRKITEIIETIGTAVYAGGTLEAGNVYRRLDGVAAHGVLLGGSLFLGVDSKLGPVYLGYGMSEGGHSAVYLYVGSSLEAF